MYSKGDFSRYINRFSVDKGYEFTHTSLIKPTGSFYVTGNDIEVFLKKYTEAYLNNEDLYVTEKHRTSSPFLIDLDFKYENDDKLERRYTNDDIKNIIELYCKYIDEYVDIEEYKIYVMEKPMPVLNNKIIKDGIHIVIPDIISKPSLQFIIREKILKNIEPILNHLNLKNSYSDVIDEAVIYRNNWLMYGSKKPNCESYKVTNVYKNKKGIIELIKDDVSEKDYPTLFSIRNKYIDTKIKIDKEEELIKFEELNMKVQKRVQSKNIKCNNNENKVEDIETIRKLVSILSPKRADNFDEWIRVGWCLRNIDYRLLDDWIVFSKKSEKFKEGECEKNWNYMREGLGIGTLHMWCKQDNLDLYTKIIDNDLSLLLIKSLSETHYDIAKVVHYIYKYDFVFASYKQNCWYEFKNHRWLQCESGSSLRTKLSTNIVNQYLKASTLYNSRAIAEENEDVQKKYMENAKKFLNIATKLKNTSFKENIMKECKDLFYVDKFEEKLDKSCTLIGFENGVYDLDTFEFREGRPEDYISFSTGINYVEKDTNSEAYNEIMDCLKKILIKDDIREYVLLLLSTFLNGSIREDKFYIWTGSGANGKSVVINLFEKSFGEYSCKFPVTLLTGKRAASNAATSELARSKGKRFGVLQEPSEDEKLNVGLMKELTGGDKIQARSIFKEPIEFIPQFKLILTCNQLPNVPSKDGGTWRRIRVVEFTSKFKYDPNPDKSNEFLIDTELSNKFDVWKEQFMAILIDYYKKYTENGIKEPYDVVKCTKEYQNNNDMVKQFLEDNCEKDDRGIIYLDELYTLFKDWCKDNAPMQKEKMNRTTFKKEIDVEWGISVGNKSSAYWKGFKLSDKDKHYEYIKDDLDN